MDHKFRAWAVNEKRFLDEDEIHLLIPFFSGYEIMQDYPHAYVLMEDTCDPGDDGIEKVLEIKWIPFTGRKDKNGREIYEGDLIREPFGAIRPVIWKDGCFFVGDNTFHNYHCGGVLFKIEIVGNIYENPELLTRKEQQ